MPASIRPARSTIASPDLAWPPAFGPQTALLPQQPTCPAVRQPQIAPMSSLEKKNDRPSTLPRGTIERFCLHTIPINLSHHLASAGQCADSTYTSACELPGLQTPRGPATRTTTQSGASQNRVVRLLTDVHACSRLGPSPEDNYDATNPITLDMCDLSSSPSGLKSIVTARVTLFTSNLEAAWPGVNTLGASGRIADDVWIRATGNPAQPH